MAVGHGLDNTGAKPLAELHHALLMARRAKMPPFTSLQDAAHNAEVTGWYEA